MAGTPYYGIIPSSSEALAQDANSAPSAGNTAAVVTLTGVVGSSWCLASLRWSYDGAPTGGKITVAWTDGQGNAAGSVEQFITAAGPGFLPYTPPHRFPVGGTVTVTLAAGGGTVKGRLGVGSWRE